MWVIESLFCGVEGFYPTNPPKIMKFWKQNTLSFANKECRQMQNQVLHFLSNTAITVKLVSWTLTAVNIFLRVNDPWKGGADGVDIRHGMFSDEGGVLWLLLYLWCTSPWNKYCILNQMEHSYIKHICGSNNKSK